MQFKDDFFQDLIIILLKYDNQKLNDAHLHNHFNALVSKIIINNLWSKSSSFYKTYKRFSERSDEITEELENSLVDEWGKGKGKGYSVLSRLWTE